MSLQLRKLYVSLLIVTDKIRHEMDCQRYRHKQVCGACGETFVRSLLINQDLVRCEHCVYVPITRKDGNEKFELSGMSSTSTASTRSSTVRKKQVHNNGLEVRDEVTDRHL